MTATAALPESNTSADGKIVVNYKDSNHSYTVNGQKAVSVTGIIGAYDKPALVYAAANVTLDGVATMANLQGVTIRDFRNAWKLGEALKARELRHWQVWGGAATRGTFVHTVLQAWIEEARVPTTDDVPVDYQPYVAGFGAFVTDHAPESVTSEVIVASAIHGYAGRYDWSARLTKRCANRECACQRVVQDRGPQPVGRIDFKTSKALYPENCAQLDLYEVAAVEMGEPQADYRAPLRLGKDGTYEFKGSKLPFGGALGLVTGFKARTRINELHADWNPKRRAK